jgi:alkanesulfonate monooxygenase SsuD/methylene tetrahydromethanopterin reductase-like flavin-dependent oxidoreductase (luciferase family)
MPGLKVGLASEIPNTRYSPTALVRGNYLTPVASSADSLWVPDYLNSLMPRAIATLQYLGGAKLIPKIDAALEPWAMLGHLAARNRVGRLRLSVGVTDAGRRNPAVTAQAAATLHLLTRGRAILGIGTGEREGNQPYGVDWTKPVARFEEAIATIRALVIAVVLGEVLAQADHRQPGAVHRCRVELASAMFPRRIDRRFGLIVGNVAEHVAQRGSTETQRAVHQ